MLKQLRLKRISRCWSRSLRRFINTSLLIFWTGVKKLSWGEESKHAEPPQSSSRRADSDQTKPNAPLQLHNTWQMSARPAFSRHPHARTRAHVCSLRLTLSWGKFTANRQTAWWKRSIQVAATAKMTASQRALSLPSPLPSSHQRLLLSDRVHVRTGYQPKPAPEKASPAV